MKIKLGEFVGVVVMHCNELENRSDMREKEKICPTVTAAPWLGSSDQLVNCPLV